MPNLPENGRLTELAVADATEGLSAAESDEFDRLLEQPDAPRRDELMQAAALIQLAFFKRDKKAWARMGLGLRAAVLAEAARRFSSRPTGAIDFGQARTVLTREPRQSARFGFAKSGWYAAAAILLVALLFYKPFYSVRPSPALAEQRATLMAEAADLINVPWGPSEQAGFTKVKGDVVWSNAEQKGFMRLLGVPANDPAHKQYQLWIVDPKRDKRPIDGGVFDVARDAETIVPINAKLAVIAPKAFAITLEQPGGVVVSAGPLLVVANVP